MIYITQVADKSYNLKTTDPLTELGGPQEVELWMELRGPDFKNLSDEDKQRYSEAEEWARNYTEGLWADSKSIPPWEFRHKGKQQ